MQLAKRTKMLGHSIAFASAKWVDTLLKYTPLYSANTSTRSKRKPEIICLIREEFFFHKWYKSEKKNVNMYFPPKPRSRNPGTSNDSHCFQPPLCTSTDEVGRKERRGKRVPEQMQRRSLSPMTEKCISRCCLPVPQHINRGCLGTSQHLMQTTSELNLCKGGKKKSLLSGSSLSLSCFRVIV